jgi:hypothetical protein
MCSSAARPRERQNGGTQCHPSRGQILSRSANTLTSVRPVLWPAFQYRMEEFPRRLLRIDQLLPLLRRAGMEEWRELVGPYEEASFEPGCQEPEVTHGYAGEEKNENWSGYVDEERSNQKMWRTAVGGFCEPFEDGALASCGPEAAVADWVGLGGVNTPRFIQTGTEAMATGLYNPASTIPGLKYMRKDTISGTWYPMHSYGPTSSSGCMWGMTTTRKPRISTTSTRWQGRLCSPNGTSATSSTTGARLSGSTGSLSSERRRVTPAPLQPGQLVLRPVADSELCNAPDGRRHLLEMGTNSRLWCLSVAQSHLGARTVH